ncbi:hypothetical protein PM082_024171 [Marasmius tenuissimus]|nr:hypothetical protein PM082_024171 [Marasmius tenuissimus]
MPSFPFRWLASPYDSPFHFNRERFPSCLTVIAGELQKVRNGWESFEEDAPWREEGFTKFSEITYIGLSHASWLYGVPTDARLTSYQ